MRSRRRHRRRVVLRRRTEAGRRRPPPPTHGAATPTVHATARIIDRAPIARRPSSIDDGAGSRDRAPARCSGSPSSWRRRRAIADLVADVHAVWRSSTGACTASSPEQPSLHGRRYEPIVACGSRGLDPPASRSSPPMSGADTDPRYRRSAVGVVAPRRGRTVGSRLLMASGRPSDRGGSTPVELSPDSRVKKREIRAHDADHGCRRIRAPGARCGSDADPVTRDLAPPRHGATAHRAQAPGYTPAAPIMSPPDDDIDRRHLDAIADAELFPYWYDDVDEPDSNPTLVRTESCDLCVVGGGYTGLWTAIIAKERDPSRDVVLIDAAEIGSAASGRNGGFMESSLTHGIANGQAALPRRDRAARAARPGEPRRHRERHPPLRHRLRLRAHRRHRRRHRRRTRRATSTSCATTPCSCAASARTPACSTPRRCGPRSTRRPTPAGCGGSGAPRSSTRPGWRGG